jgi:hypothetical protein
MFPELAEHARICWWEMEVVAGKKVLVWALDGGGRNHHQWVWGGFGHPKFLLFFLFFSSFFF